MHQVPEPPPAAHPRRIGRYTLVREIGAGGEGTIWLAEDHALGRQVALKVLPARARDEDRVAPEARIVARLDHPGICPVLDAGEADGVRFIALRYVEGTSLAERMEADRARGRMLLATASDSTSRARARILDFFEHVARALHAAHEAGVVHGDVNSRNLMVDVHGDPVLLDFGIATTPMPLDRSRDLAALGALLHEALLGRPPCEAARADARVLGREGAAIVARCAATAPEARYGNAHELAEDLQRARLLRPVRAGNAPVWERLRLWCRRHPQRVAVAVLGLGAAALVLVALSWLSLRTSRAAAERDLRTAQVRGLVRDLATVGADGAPFPGATATRAALATKAVQAADELAHAVPEEAGFVLERMRAHASVANLNGDPGSGNLSAPRVAIAEWTRAIELGTRFVADDPAIRALTIDCLQKRAEVRLGENQLVAASADLALAATLLPATELSHRLRLRDARLRARMREVHGELEASVAVSTLALLEVQRERSWVLDAALRLEVARTLRGLGSALAKGNDGTTAQTVLEIATAVVSGDARRPGPAATELAELLGLRNRPASRPGSPSSDRLAAIELCERRRDADPSDRAAQIQTLRIALDAATIKSASGIDARAREELEALLTETTKLASGEQASGTLLMLAARAQSSAARLLERSDEDRLTLGRAAVATMTGVWLRDRSNIRVLAELLEERVTIARHLLRVGSRDAARTELEVVLAAIARCPADVALVTFAREAVTNTFGMLGAIACERDRLQEGITLLEAALAWNCPVDPTSPPTVTELRNLGSLVSCLAAALAESGRGEAAARTWQLALARWDAAPRETARRPELALAAVEDRVAAAVFHRDAGLGDEADALFTVARHRLETLYAAHANDPLLAWPLARACRAIADALVGGPQHRPMQGCATSETVLWYERALETMEYAAKVRTATSEPDRAICRLVKNLARQPALRSRARELRQRWARAMSRVCARPDASPADLATLARERLDSREPSLVDAEDAVDLARRAVRGGGARPDFDHVLTLVDALERTERQEEAQRVLGEALSAARERKAPQEELARLEQRVHSAASRR